MSYGAALNIGRSGLLNSKTALDTAGHNLANAATRGYHRQTVSLSPASSTEVKRGVFVGNGVKLESITRQIDQALEGRLRSAIADESGASKRQELLKRLESIENEFTDADLSTRLGKFFDAWSNLANNPQDVSLRSLVSREAQTLTSFVQGMRDEMVQLRGQADEAANDAANRVDDLLSQIEDLNEQIVVQDGGNGGATGLRDQRTQVLEQLSQQLDVSTVQRDRGVTDVYVGSTPLVLNGKSRGVELVQRTIDGEVQKDVVVKDDQTPLDVSSGQLGAIVEFRQNDVTEAINTLDTLTNELAWQVNRVHSQGQGLSLRDEVTGHTKLEDATAALNNADAGLDFTPEHGSFQLHVTQTSTGQRQTSTVNIDLDGINPAGDTTLTSLAGQINGVANVSASVTSDNRLKITTASDDFQISFSDDTSGALAALGVNTFFTGSDAQDIAVAQDVVSSPRLLAVAQGHQAGDNSNALAIEGLRSQPADALGGFSITEYWNRHVEEYGARLAQAREQVQANETVKQSLESQRQAHSGVNVDEESIDLMRYQRAYQASARFLTVVDEMMQTLLQVV